MKITEDKLKEIETQIRKYNEGMLKKFIQSAKESGERGYYNSVSEADYDCIFEYQEWLEFQ